MDHSFRRNNDAFTKRRVEKDAPPPRLSGAETWKQVHKYPKVTDEWTNLIQHNLDVMNVEKNVFDNIFNTVMDDKDKTKDNWYVLFYTYLLPCTDIKEMDKIKAKTDKAEHEKERVHKSQELSSYGQQKSTLVNNGQLTK
ncbi:hypothetical protein Tco_1291518 [Tanacetum coccineum]